VYVTVAATVVWYSVMRFLLAITLIYSTKKYLFLQA
jgi:hypothetical protein